MSANAMRIRPRVPGELERLATIWLKAQGDDYRLGDLSEQYVRTYDHVRAHMGNTPLAMVLARLAADIRYLLSAANVALFAPAVDQALPLAQPTAKETIAIDLKERTMALLHASARKLVLPALLLVASSFLVNGAANVWTTWRETEALIINLQREKADAAAAQISQYLAALQDQVSLTTLHSGSGVPLEQRRYDDLRLLRQVPAITEIVHLSSEGKEVLKVSRLRLDVAGSGTDFSGDTRFREARKGSPYISPVYFNKQSEPYVSLATANASGVTVSEVNIRRLWDIVDALKVGQGGYGYVVDGKGRLIAIRDHALVLRQTDLSGLPQVAAASSPATLGTVGEDPTFDTSPFGTTVISVHASVPAAGWKVFVELPVAEARASLWSALGRVAVLLGLGLLAIVLAGFAAARRATPTRLANR